MKLKILLLSFCFIGCHSSNKVKDLIQGKWYFDDITIGSDTYIHITENDYTVENDSPISEDYKLVGDTILLKGFEARDLLFSKAPCSSCSFDTSKILKITKDTLILKDGKEIIKLHKK